MAPNIISLFKRSALFDWLGCCTLHFFHASIRAVSARLLLLRQNYTAIDIQKVIPNASIFRHGYSENDSVSEPFQSTFVLNKRAIFSAKIKLRKGIGRVV